MPQAGELPPSLAKLARRQALELSPADSDSMPSGCSGRWTGPSPRARDEAGSKPGARTGPGSRWNCPAGLDAVQSPKAILLSMTAGMA
jgi:hypothetical protein